MGEQWTQHLHGRWAKWARTIEINAQARGLCAQNVEMNADGTQMRVQLKRADGQRTHCVTLPVTFGLDGRRLRQVFAATDAVFLDPTTRWMFNVPDAVLRTKALGSQPMTTHTLAARFLDAFDQWADGDYTNPTTLKAKNDAERKLIDAMKAHDADAMTHDGRLIVLWPPEFSYCNTLKRRYASELSEAIASGKMTERRYDEAHLHVKRPPPNSTQPAPWHLCRREPGD